MTFHAPMFYGLIVSSIDGEKFVDRSSFIELLQRIKAMLEERRDPPPAEMEAVQRFLDVVTDIELEDLNLAALIEVTEAMPTEAAFKDFLIGQLRFAQEYKPQQNMN